MRAVIVERPGGPEVLQLRDDWPRPNPKDGHILIRIMAFGLNRGEIYTRLGYSPSVQFPRVLGIECAGVVEAAPATAFNQGQIVVATTGGMGRAFDGSYAEFVNVPAHCVHAVNTNLSWSQLASVPEVFHTAWGALMPAMGVSRGQSLLIRGGSSSVGLVAANLARERGLSIISTTRDPTKSDLLKSFGVDFVITDNGQIGPRVRELVSEGVDAMLDLVGTNVIEDSFLCVRRGGILCMAGLLGGEWEIKNFVPGATIPSTTKFTYFSSSMTPMPNWALEDYIAGIKSDKYRLPLDRVFRLEEIQKAHSYMEANAAAGKIVIDLT
ncbi:MAG: putative quinone oxidoreductase YhfP [Alphaproteobacteria bacterium MarineAlpha11_Bin1]|nr:MAG: putative quinone oxidoreductase YhfP [Alphaproteobacteria bacterium MarineAlpha11_Bin1]|tara:strand:+ start:1822 stop:2796 length:975 start_codon:yes stop_codon:yes gene_type:complete